MGEVVLHGIPLDNVNLSFDSAYNGDSPYTLTLPTLDDKLVTGEFTNEDGMKVVIEEKQK